MLPNPVDGHVPVHKVIRIALTMASATCILFVAFVLPQLNPAPRGLPIAFAGTGDVAARIKDKLQNQSSGAFAVSTVPDLASAAARVLDRDSYGAIVIQSSGVTVLQASAASPLVAQVMQQLASTLESNVHVKVTVQDLKPMPAGDSKGIALAISGLPVVAGSVFCALALLIFVNTAAKRLLGALTFAVVGGLVITAVTKFGLDAITGNYLLASAGVTLGLAAISCTVLGLRSALGDLGMLATVVLLLLLGMPLAALNTAPELLPPFWGALGQYLPPGAAGGLLRSTEFFEGRGALVPEFALIFWLLLGIGLCFAGDRRGARPPAPAAVGGGETREPGIRPAEAVWAGVR
jgi:hypothetical protein